MPDPRDAQAHHAGDQGARRHREPGGRRDRQARGEAHAPGGRQVTQILDDVDRAIKDIAAGRPGLVVDDENRENEGDIIFAASAATPELLAFMIRYTSGGIGVHHRPTFTASVDVRAGPSTGISAAARAATIRALVDPATPPAGLVRPGHV